MNNNASVQKLEKKTLLNMLIRQELSNKMLVSLIVGLILTLAAINFFAARTESETKRNDFTQQSAVAKHTSDA